MILLVRLNKLLVYEVGAYFKGITTEGNISINGYNDSFV